MQPLEPQTKAAKQLEAQLQTVCLELWPQLLRAVLQLALPWEQLVALEEAVISKLSKALIPPEAELLWLLRQHCAKQLLL
jgi:hypothetical protein